MSSKTSVDLDLIRGERSRRSLIEFVRTFWPTVEPAKPFVEGWHLEAIADHLTALAKRELKNLLITLPPRHCKSTLCDVMFPAWQWLHQSGEEFLFTSFKIDLAERDSVRCRRLIGSDLYRKCFGSLYSLREDQNTKRRFSNDKGGTRLVSSILGSGPTGEGGSIIIVDDPHSVNDTESESRRLNTCRWFTEVFFNRLTSQKTGCRLVIGQRIHNEDLAGHLLENQKDFWTHLNLPWDFDEKKRTTTSIGWTDPRTIEGQPLWPEAWPESEIDMHRKRPQYFESQFNQRPLNADSALFKREQFRYYEETPDCYKIEGRVINKADCFYTLIAADLAISQDKRADYTAIVTATIAKSGEIILLDVVRERMNGTKIVPKLRELYDEFQPQYLMIEDVAFQKVIVDQARAEGLPVRQLKPCGDKEVRSLTLQTRFAAGQVWFPRAQPLWLKPLEAELVTFPQGSHDDQVDALSYLAREAALKTRTRPTAAPPPEEPKRSYEEIYNAALMQGIE
jgi:predicted phage terminase large subunit-like protein